MAHISCSGENDWMIAQNDLVELERPRRMMVMYIYPPFAHGMEFRIERRRTV